MNRRSSSSETSSVALRDVTKRFGDVVAVDDLSLDLAGGEFFTLLGPSGCGKTTTLRMIAGFEQPTAGEIRIEGEDVAGLPPHRRPTNTVFQSYALFPHLSVEDNVAFGLKRKRVPRDEIATRVAAELERVGLATEAKRRPSQLSGGMQQRVALARALVNLPKVLLLDEPLGALDLKLRKGLQVELKRIQREVGITFVYVTHDQEEALTMSDRIAVMNGGRIEQVGVPEDVYERPETTFVAGFIGVSNLMPATVAGPGEVQLEERPPSAWRHRRPRPRRRLLRRRATREATSGNAGHGRRRLERDAADRGNRRELDLPRHGDADRGRLRGRGADDRARAQRRRERAATTARRGRPGGAQLGPGAHARGP